MNPLRGVSMLIIAAALTTSPTTPNKKVLPTPKAKWPRPIILPPKPWTIPRIKPLVLRDFPY
jgi:hypothetical protein